MSDILLPDDWQQLRNASRAVRQYAYAPYSKFRVGSAIQTASDDIIVGCNVENSSYGGTICAERTAACSAVAQGQTDFTAICISLDGEPVPCGICRQFLFEFNPDLLLLLDNVNTEAAPECVLLSQLLPRGFRL